MKMQIFCAVFNSSNCADTEKNKSNYRFPSIVKNNRKEGLTFSKVGREKSLAQIFRKDLTEKKLEKTRMKIMLFASPLLFFSQSSRARSLVVRDLRSETKGSRFESSC